MAKLPKNKKKAPKTSPPESSGTQPKSIFQAGEIAPLRLAGMSWTRCAQVLFIAAAVLWIYWPALNGGWIRDDHFYLPQNPLLHDPGRLWKLWFEPGSFIEYYPLEETIQFIQWELWQNNTLGYHLTNVILHFISALLVWRLFSKLGLRLAWLGGLIFAVHPMQVESVAWISELKNTLSLPLFLGAMCAWIDFDASRRKQDYLLAVVLFLAACLCKISVVAFPILILLHAWWKRREIGWNDLKATVPFAVISIVLAAATMLAGSSFQSHHLLSNWSVPVGGVLSHLALIGLTSSFYFAACFLPWRPMPFYPLWTLNPPTLLQFLPWPIMFGAVYWLWTKREGWGRHALFGLGFLFLFLAPFLGFVPASYMRLSWVMDHLLYLPILGAIGLITAGCSGIEKQLPRSLRPIGIGIVALFVFLMAWESHSYAAAFESEEALWTYMLKEAPDSALAHENLGDIDVNSGRYSEALKHFYSALKSDPNPSEIHVNIGVTLAKAGQVQAAIQQFEMAIQEDPKNVSAYSDWGAALLNLKQYSEAIDKCKTAVSLQPNSEYDHLNMAVALRKLGRLDEAVREYEQVVIIDPSNLRAHQAMTETLSQKNLLRPEGHALPAAK